MGWNRPSEEKKVEVEGKGRQWNGRLKGLIASAIVVFGAFVAAWWFRPEEEARRDAASTKPAYIADVAPSVPTNGTVAAEGKTDGERKLDEKGRPLLTNVIRNVPGRRTPRPVRVIVHDDGAARRSPSIFPAMSDDHLEQLANWQPGEAFVSIVSPAEIAKDFMAHVADKIEVSPDDPPEVAERKRNYARVREEIKREIRAGADLEEMIVEARRTLERVSNMRTEYMNAIREAREGGASEEDIDDLATAASMLLKEHGANPILSPNQKRKLWEERKRKELEEKE